MLNNGVKGQVVSTEDKIIKKDEVKIGSLLGSFPHRLDPKRRLTIPSIFRNRMGGPSIVYVLPDLNNKNCLEVFQPAAFEMRLGKLNEAALTDSAASEFVTMIGSVSETLDIDVQGRIRISDHLLAHIGVERDVVIIGAVNRIQIWAKGNEPSLKTAFANVTEAARRVNF